MTDLKDQKHSVPQGPATPGRRRFLRFGVAGLVAGTGLLAGCEARAPRQMTVIEPAPMPETLPPQEAVPGMPLFPTRAVLSKMERSLVFFDGDREVKRYSVAIGRGGPGPKREEGDALTPEGRYHMMPPGRESLDGFRWFIPISYPNAEDKARAAAAGGRLKLGGAIGLHGTGDGPWEGIHARGDRSWTLGCLAVTNQEIDEIREMISYNGRRPFPIDMRA